MGMEEVITFLKNNGKKPLSRTEIAEGLKEDPNKISVIINKLLKWREIEAIEIDRIEAKKKYNCYRRMCLYIAID